MKRRRKLSLPSGAYEICLMVQDRILNEKSQLVYRATQDDGPRFRQARGDQRSSEICRLSMEPSTLTSMSNRACTGFAC